MSAIATAVISSTIRGLPEHRKAAQDACLRAGFFPEMMEHLGPTPADAVKESLAMVDKADVYVLILGVRYGEIPDGYDKSFTHLELDRAVERGLPKLILIMDTGKHPLVADDVEKGPGAEHLDELRTRLRREQVVSFFSSADEMRTLLVQGLSKLKQSVAPATPSIHYVRELTSPPDPYVAHPYTLLQTTDVIGRQRELNVLTDWVSNTSSQLFEAHILSLIAIGGMGKSAITWKWFNDIAPHEMPALCGRVWWSFYESDAHFDNFVIRTLAYVTRRPLEVVKELRPGEREEELLDVLDREPHLIVLDGLERLLIAYARPDANRLADDDLDVQTANVVADALGLPPSAAASYTGQSRLRLTADPRAGSFLRRLSQISESRVLVSSRLFPADLQTVTGAPVVGAAAYFLGGLDSDDAVNLWRAFQVTGRRDELVALFQTFDNYPLLVRALAGEVARFRRAPGDFDAWRASHPDFDPFRLPLTQRKAHVLQYALRGLAAPETRLLHLIAAFRMPAQFATLTALTVGPGLPFHDEAELDAALFNLEDRGLVGWDKRANRYDLHPVVRGVAWSTVDSQSQRGIYSNVAKHFESLPHLDVLSAKTIDDLAAVIELYHTLVRLERGANAFEILYDRIWAPAFRLGAFLQLGELTELLLSEPAALMDLDEEDRVVHLAWMGFAFQTCGFPERYLDAYEKIGDLPPEQERHFRADLLAIRAMAQRLTGSLAAAHASAQNSLVACVTNHKDDVWRPWPGVLALGLVLATLGDSEAMRWLEDYRLTQTEERVASPPWPPTSWGGWLSIMETSSRLSDSLTALAELPNVRRSG